MSENKGKLPSVVLPRSIGRLMEGRDAIETKNEISEE